MLNQKYRAELEAGLGYGAVNERAREILEKAWDLARKRRTTEARTHLDQALALDPNNLDAYILGASLSIVEHALGVLKYAEKRGKTILKLKLGKNAFEDSGPSVGKFWEILETRPYIRVLSQQIYCFMMVKKYKECCDTICESLRLCPSDNEGNSCFLGSVLLHLNRNSDALYFSQFQIGQILQPAPYPPYGGTLFSNPRRSLLDKDQERRLEDWVPGYTLYTAALSSFRLWGADSHEARQYLHLAVRANPHILVRVLGKVSKPAQRNMEPRSLNSNADAHDYLWLAQDLWTKPSVWEWANNDEVVKSFVLKPCSRAKCPKREIKIREFQRCSGCHQPVYCSSACQSQDWVNHKKACKEHKNMKAARHAFSLGRDIPEDFMVIGKDDDVDARSNHFMVNKARGVTIDPSILRTIKLPVDNIAFPVMR
ncbi:hypothetical protein DL96DRAFT_1527549 [Flagelloscypha sp. PMI_526]|nr:hypothetical protein DL96DRAFT_1527549 [Flagelloscypha sp. PMI_526]